ncbi:MAG: hypothetical protein KTR32_18790 [Granulosicoccus sp.]|nr:hypothetical protein [Granulosicoccus sp.]
MIRYALLQTARVVSVLILLVASFASAQAENVIGQNDGTIDWNGWELDYTTFELSDGLILNNVKYNGVPLLGRASFPVMSVYYEGPCGPYADRLNGPQQPVSWANNALLVAREFTQEGKLWFELGIREFIGSYDIYQAWYISEDGELDGHAFSRGLQCNYDHVHYPMWRLDFDIDGPANDRILREVTPGVFSAYTTEFQTNATDAFQHGWYVEDTVSGYRVRVGFDNGDWNVAGTVVPESSYASNLVGGLVSRSNEEGWTGGASQDFRYNNGESLVNSDVVMWYRGYLPHTPDEGSALWHSTGVRIFVDQATDTDGDGEPDVTDTDDDNDGILDVDDDLPLDPNESVDTDGDGIGNNADTDDDGDGVADADDVFPLDASESSDTDGDGIGDNADIDADNDGLPDVVESGAATAFAVLDDFEAASGWVTDPDNNDTATTGAWQVGDPQGTSSGGATLQADAASNGVQALITGLTAGSSVGTNDIDNGDTTVLSPALSIPVGATELSLDYYFAHLNNATSDDYFRISIVSAGASSLLLNETGTGLERSVVWTPVSFDVSSYAGTSVQLLIEAADAGGGSLIEAGVDNIQVFSPANQDIDGDQIINSLDLDSDNDSIADVIEAGLSDADGDFIVDDLSAQGSVLVAPDTDGDDIADFLDLESANSSNNGSNYDISVTEFVVLDTNNDGQINAGDVAGGVDNNSNGVDDAIEAGIDPIDCGPPAYDAAVDRALFVWQDCDGVFHMVGTGADEGASYVGMVASETDFASVSAVSIEASDSVDNVPADRIFFDISLGGIYVDEILYTLDAGASACIGVTDQSAGTAILAGSARTPVTSPFDPVTLQSCEMPVNTDCGTPSIDPATDAGAYIWNECNGTWSMQITGEPGGDSSGYSGVLSTTTGFSNITPLTIEPSDVVTSPSVEQINFNLVTSNPWEDRFSFEINQGDELCVNVAALPAGLSVYAGVAKTPVSGPFNPISLATCTPPDSGCDTPDFDAANERTLLTWIDCAGDLHLVGTGAAAGARYAGQVYATAPFDNVAGLSLEPSDVLNTALPDAISFDISMGGPWVDRIIATPAAGSELCISVDLQSTGTALLAGGSRTPVTSPFNPSTLESCTPPVNTDCGNPLVDPAIDGGLFVWKACDGVWSMMITGDSALGGVSYEGSISSSTGFASVTPVTTEASDSLSTDLSAPIAFSLATGSPWEDRFEFVPNADAELCVTITDMPATLGRYAGPARTPVSLSFNPVTFEDCQ